jgi:hypothetical protein
MDRTSKRIVVYILGFIMTLVLIGCGSSRSLSEMLTRTVTPLPPSVGIDLENPAQNNSQATIDTGNLQLVDIARQQTQASLNLTQGANLAAISTQAALQRQKVDMDLQATAVSLEITQAAATQSEYAQQTHEAATATQAAHQVLASQTARAQAVLDAMARQTAEAAAHLTAVPLTQTYSAYVLNLTVTVQVRNILETQAAGTQMAVAALTAYPMTLTPAALTQEALLFQRYADEQQSFKDRVLDPLAPFLVVLVLILFIAAIIYFYHRFIAEPRLAPPTGSRMIIDSVIVDQNPPYYLDAQGEPVSAVSMDSIGDSSIHVEVMDPSEAPVANWIADVEEQLRMRAGQRQ